MLGILFFLDSVIFCRADWLKTKIFMEPPNQMAESLPFRRHMFSEVFTLLETHVLIILFCKTQQRYFDLNVKSKFLKNLSLQRLRKKFYFYRSIDCRDANLRSQGTFYSSCKITVLTGFDSSSWSTAMKIYHLKI